MRELYIVNFERIKGQGFDTSAEIIQPIHNNQKFQVYAGKKMNFISQRYYCFFRCVSQAKKKNERALKKVVANAGFERAL